ncbi:MAG: right-handed parallel beta-helix repeat-containing protein [Oceanicaulis sp.]
MAFTTAQDFIDVWQELDAAYVTFPAIAGAGGDYTAPSGTVDTAGQFSDTVSQFPGLAHTIDNTSVDAGALAYAVNALFVELAEAYIDWLDAGNDPILDFIAKDRGGAPAPGQSLHDNILGNLNDGPINDRFVTANGNPDIDGDGIGDVVAEPRSADGQAYGDRPVFSGSNTNNFAESIAWDLANGLSVDQLDVSRGGLDPLDGKVFLASGGDATEYGSIQAAVDAAADGDTIFVGSGTYAENLVIDKALSFEGIGDVSIEPASGTAVFVDAGVDGDLSFENIDLAGNGAAGIGIDVQHGANVGTLTINDGSISGFTNRGIYASDDGDPAGTPTMADLVVTNVDFSDNGTGSGNTAHVKLFGFSGDATFDTVTFDGTTGVGTSAGRPDNAIEMTGFINNEGNANPVGANAPNIGNVTVNNVTVSGEYHKNPIAFFNFGEIDGLSITGLDLSGAESWWGPLFNLDGFSDENVDASGFGITFPSTSAVHAEIQGEKDAQGPVNSTITGTSGNDSLHGKEGDDTLNGGDGDDILYGGNKPGGAFDDGAGDDTLNGGAGDDTLVGGIGNDALNGGAGSDVARYDGSSTDFTLTAVTDASGMVTGFSSVVDNNAGDGDEGTDTLTEVEAVSFAGDGVTLDASAPVQVFNGSGDLVGTFDSIQGAIDAAASGDTIQIAAGTFREQIEIDGKTDLTITGQGDATVIEMPDNPAFINDTTATSRDRAAVISAEESSNIVIEDLLVDGRGLGEAMGSGTRPDFEGIFFGDTSGTIDDVTVTGMRDSLNLDGTPKGNQRGVGIVVDNGDGAARTVVISNSTIEDFQKNGMAIAGTGLTVDIDGNQVSGSGFLPATNAIAQNGIQVGFGAGGSITNNTIDGVGYLRGDWVTTGMLVYEAADGIEITGNTVVGATSPGGENTHYAIYLFGETDNAVLTGNTIESSIAGIAAANNVDGVDISGNLFQNMVLSATPNTGGDAWSGNNVELYGSANDSAIVGFSGTDGADFLGGSALDDTLSGGDGDDTLSGGAGDDTLNGDAGDDTVQGGAGDDLVQGGAGNDELIGDVSSELDADYVEAGGDLGTSYSTDFDGFAPLDFSHNSDPMFGAGDGWTGNGVSGLDGGAQLDAELVSDGDGGQALRISNAVTSGNYDTTWPFAPSVDLAGETAGSVNDTFAFAMTFQSATTTEQPGASIDITPGQQGTAIRQAIVRVVDNGDADTGLTVGYWQTVEADNANGYDFNFVELATNLDRTVEHDIAVEMVFNGGSGNDEVRVTINGETHTGLTSWELYFENSGDPAGPTAAVDTVGFRNGGTAEPGVAGGGFIFDDLTTASYNQADITTGNDTLVGGLGDDVFDGGQGVDTAVIADAGGSPYDAAAFDFSGLTVDGGSVSGTLVGPDGAETLRSIEVLEVANTGSSTFVVLDGMSIQAAIDAASAGDTIEVAAGTYAESLTIDKALTIIGADGAVLQGPDGAATAVSIQSGDVTFENFDIQGFSDGIIVGYEASPPGDLQNVVIRDNDIDLASGGNPHGFGIYAGFEAEGLRDGVIPGQLDYSGLVIEGNSVTGSSNAALVLQSIQASGTDILVLQNTFEDAGASGVWIDSASNIDLVGNVIQGNSFGVYVDNLVAPAFDSSNIEATNTGFRGNANGDFVGGDVGNVTQVNTYSIQETFYVDVNATGAGDGSSPADAFTSIQAAVDAALGGDTIQIAAGTYSESVTVDKALDFQGAGAGSTIIEPASGDGFHLVGDLGTDAEVSIDGVTVTNASGSGVEFDDNAILGTLTISNSAFEQNDYNGVQIGANDNPVDLDRVVIEDSSFTGNGQPDTGSSGDGDLNFFQFNGAATLRNLTIVGQDRDAGPAENAIQFRSDHGPLGNVRMINVDISGVYEKVGVAFYGYDNLDSLLVSNVDVSAETGWNLPINIDGVGGDFFAPFRDFDMSGAPADHVYAIQGDDTANVLTGDEANNYLKGEGGADTLRGGDGADALIGDGGDDVLNGQNGDDTLRGGEGADFLRGGAGYDTADYSTSSAGVDVRLFDETSPTGGDATGDYVESIEGLIGSDHDDVLMGTAGDFIAEGGAGNDRLRGFGGDDDLDGGAGDDELFGGAGDDALTGGDGVDTAVFHEAGASPVTLADFDLTGLTIDGSGSVSGTVTTGSGTDTLDSVEVLKVDDTGAGSSTYIVLDGMSLQAALDDAQDGDTILLGEGSWSGAYAIDKSLSLIGANAGVAGGDAGRGAESIIDGGLHITADGASIDGLQIEQGALMSGSSAGVYVQAGGVSVENTDFVRTEGFGVFRGVVTAIGDGQGLTVDSNAFEGWATGVYLNPTSNASVTNNVFDGNNVGLSNDGPDADTISGNDFANSTVEHIGIGALNAVSLLNQIIGANTYDGTAEPVTVYAAGGAGAQIYGSAADEIFVGSGVADVIRAGDGDDTLNGNGGNDILNGREGNDTVNGGAGNDILQGRQGEDVLSGGDGDDQLYAGADNDLLSGGDGADIVDGGAGYDTADYSDSDAGVNVRLWTGSSHSGGHAAGDTTFGIEGLVGSDFNDTLHGTNADFVGDGGAGNDRVRGFNGEDTLTGGLGDDELWGGANADTFIFEADSGTDIIWDFNAVNQDLIDLSAFGVSDISDLTINSGGGFVDITGFGANGETIRLFNVDENDLDNSDFLFT